MDCNSKVQTDCGHRLEWMKDKPPFVALMASAPVLAADECYALLQVCVGKQPFPVQMNPQCVEDWLQLYSDHRAVAKSLAEVFSKALISSRQGSDEEFAEFLFGDGSCVGSVEFLDDAIWRRAFERIEVQFFFRLTMPCLIMHGTSPIELLASVGRGGPAEWDNIERLVALDPLILGHRRIARMLNCEDVKQRQERAELLGKCLGKPLPEMSKRRVKTMLAAGMSRISELLGHRFAEPDIRALFDAIAKDRGIGARDPDLPESPEAFSKAIQRYRAYWHLPEQPDAESLAAVRALETSLS